MPYKINVAPSKAVDLSKNQQADFLTGQTNVSRSERIQQREMEARQKDGTIPALKNEDGKDINPHTPLYIMQVPWYYNALNPTLKHQASLKEKKQYASISSWYRRGTTGVRANKFMKGSCENCGSTTHSKKNCFEKPRAVGAKYNNSNIAEDDFIQPEIETDYDGKRDRWNNYDMSEHSKVLDEYSKVDNVIL